VEPTARALLADLHAVADPGTYPNRHYHGGAPVLGVRMGTLFDVAKRYAGLPRAEVERLLAEPAYEPRLAAFCVLDFAVRRRGVTPAERAERYDLYLGHHDRIDAWDMVDRAAPRVVGEHLRGRSRDPLFALAGSSDPLRRRTAMTAPLAYVRGTPDPAEIADLLLLAEVLLDDADPLVRRPVGIALRHAGAVAPDAVTAFLDQHGDRVPVPVRRMARETLPTSRFAP
jgi:3-methyladenine DNA glycosylase AlkD